MKDLSETLDGVPGSSPRYAFRDCAFDEVFKELDYGSHFLVMGDINTGKSNLMTWFMINTLKRCVFFNVEGMPEPNNVADVNMDDKGVQNKELTKALRKPGVRKISISPSDSCVSDSKGLMSLWNNVCEQVFTYREPIYDRIMKAKELREGIDYFPQALVILINDETIECMRGEEMVRYHRAIMIRGRKRGIGTMHATQRHQNISKQLTTKTHKISFYLDDYDIDVLRSKIPLVQQLGGLPPYHFVKQVKGSQEIKRYRPCPHIIKSRKDILGGDVD